MTQKKLKNNKDKKNILLNLQQNFKALIVAHNELTRKVNDLSTKVNDPEQLVLLENRVAKLESNKINEELDEKESI